MDNDSLQDLIGRVYDAAADASLWRSFLDRLADAVGADGAVLFAIAPESPLLSVSALTRFDAELIDRQARELADNAWAQQADVLFRSSEIRYSQALTTPGEIHAYRYFADFFWPAQAVHGVGLKLAYGAAIPAYLAASRVPGKPPFESAEGSMLLALAPHLRRALELHRRLGGAAAFAEVLDGLPSGMIFANRRGRPVWWNRYAGDVLANGDGLWLSNGGFQTSHPAETAQLRGLVLSAAAPQSDAHSRGGAMAVSRPSMRRPYAVLVSPVWEGSGPETQPAAAILLTDPERSVPDGAEQRLAGHFGLTPGEARVATLLIHGRTVEETAADLSIGVATVRTHVRNLLQKTSTTRQSELVGVLLRTPSPFTYVGMPSVRTTPF